MKPNFKSHLKNIEFQISHLTIKNIICISNASCHGTSTSHGALECTGCPIYKIREILEMAYLDSVIYEYELFYMFITKLNGIDITYSHNGAELTTAANLSRSIALLTNNDINITLKAQIDVDSSRLIVISSFTQNHLTGDEPLRKDEYVDVCWFSLCMFKTDFALVPLEDGNGLHGSVTRERYISSF